MPTTPIERLLFAQGGKCFFCQRTLPRTEASVEHLVASANGGSNSDGNCVACCKAVNALLGSMSLKEKFRVVLNQQGSFICPNATPRLNKPAPKTVKSSAPAAPSKRYELILKNLDGRGNAKPRKSKTLRNSITTLFPGVTPAEVEALIVELKAAGKLTENESKVTYAL